jgi:hypothetical protein
MKHFLGPLDSGNLLNLPYDQFSAFETLGIFFCKIHVT